MLCFALTPLGGWAFDPSFGPNELITLREQALREQWSPAQANERLMERLNEWERRAPIQWDWLLQDGLYAARAWLINEKALNFGKEATEKVLNDIHREAPAADVARLVEKRERLETQGDAASEMDWLTLYFQACQVRRQARLAFARAHIPQFVAAAHYPMGGSHYAYTEGQSDAQRERTFIPGAALQIWRANETDPLLGYEAETLINDPDGVIRDPDVSFDGKRILFAWKKSDRQDDYHLYEIDVDTRDIRTLTSGLGVADYEGVYLPNGDIVFNSTRCVQTVDCWWTEVSNLYACGPDGQNIRRLTYDQVHTNFPTLTNDGRILYTRWEYNDRGQIYPQPLFQMNYDGAGQTEFYGNNSYFPTTILHARAIPGTAKVVAIATGHHSIQKGQLILIDPARGRQENEGVQLIAPLRETPAVRIDAYGQEGPQAKYPWPLSETEYLVSYDPVPPWRGPGRFKIYWMNQAGQRELLAAHEATDLNRPVPLVPRNEPRLRPTSVDYGLDAGTYYIQDIYAGPGLEGVPRGDITAVRVVALDFRVAGIGDNRNQGEAGGALISTPIAIGNGTWDVKTVLGTATVYPDGSAFFEVPARTPVYFQALNKKGHSVQSMRSWSTLQPGETQSCVGCHESKNGAPLAVRPVSMAMQAGPQPLAPRYADGPRGFSYIREVQPILDRHCVGCHDNRDQRGPTGRPPKPGPDGKPSVFSLRGDQTVESQSLRKWSDSYLALTRARGVPLIAFPHDMVHWISSQSAPPMLPPYAAGAAKSALIPLLRNGHGDVKLSEEALQTIACWIDLGIPYCGDYTEANAWSPDQMAFYNYYLNKRQQLETEDAETRRRLAGMEPDRPVVE